MFSIKLDCVVREGEWEGALKRVVKSKEEIGCQPQYLEKSGFGRENAQDLDWMQWHYLGVGLRHSYSVICGESELELYNFIY